MLISTSWKFLCFPTTEMTNQSTTQALLSHLFLSMKCPSACQWQTTPLMPWIFPSAHPWHWGELCSLIMPMFLILSVSLFLQYHFYSHTIKKRRERRKERDEWKKKRRGKDGGRQKGKKGSREGGKQLTLFLTLFLVHFFISVTPMFLEMKICIQRLHILFYSFKLNLIQSYFHSHSITKTAFKVTIFSNPIIQSILI